MEDMILCNICDKKSSKFGIKNHISIVHDGKIDRISHKIPFKKGCIPWNKGLKKETDSRVLKNSENVAKNEKIKNGTFRGKKHTVDYINKMSKLAFNTKLGGHTSKKSIYYTKKDDTIVYLQSSWEEKLAILLDTLCIEWTRPNPLMWIDASNKSHRYYADFYLIKYDVYLDPKNSFLRCKDKDKIEKVQIQNNIKIVILDISDMTETGILNIIVS